MAYVGERQLTSEKNSLIGSLFRMYYYSIYGEINPPEIRA